MCGIAGALDFHRLGAPGDGGAFARTMAERLHRRGPDDSGIWTDEMCTLVHARLSVIDLGGSRQPMVDRRTGAVLVFNGEIYNYRDLRRDLASAGEAFESNGDTEVLLRLVQRSGVEGLSRLRGMFAFALWIPKERRLLLARDPLGKKPLFWSMPRPGTYVFGSEIKTLLAHPDVEAILDADGLRQALRFRATYGERTLYAGVRQVLPGEWIEITEQGVRRGSYFDLVAAVAEKVVRRRSAPLGVDELDAAIADAVEARLVSDVPVGVFLSGGVDSSLVTSLAAEGLARWGTIHTYSVGFEQDRHSELPAAMAVARAVGSSHENVEVGARAFGARMVDLTGCRDAPLGEPADTALGLLSERAKRDVTVVLSGEGADEGFAGYPKYSLARWSRFGAMVLRCGGARLLEFPGVRARLPRRIGVVADSWSAPSEVEGLARWFDYLGPDRLANLFPGLGETDRWREAASAHGEALARVHRGFSGASAIQRMQLVDCLTWLPGNMLERGDRMAMAFGLEARMPFVDATLMVEGIALADGAKVHRSVRKIPLRRLLRRRLGEEAARRRKWGFRVPLETWFRGPLRADLEGRLFASNSLTRAVGDERLVRAMVQRLMEGQSLGTTMWSLFSTEVWYQEVYQARDRGRT